MNIGWVKLHRQFKDWEWYNKSEMVHLFIHCLIKANFKDGSFQGIECKKGSFITSLKHLSDETNISIQTIRTCLKKLQLTKEIDVKSTNKLTQITICNYDSYQQENEDTNKQLTNNQQTTNKQLTTNKKNKEELRRKEEENIYRAFAHLKITTAEFDKLIADGWEKEQIDETLDNIQNYAKNKDYVYLYLTARKWLAKQPKKGLLPKHLKNFVC